MIRNRQHTVVAGELMSPPFDKKFEQDRRVYSVCGIAPTVHTMGGAIWSRRYLLNMIERQYLGWVRDSTGRVTGRPVKAIANAVTTMCGGGFADPTDGLGNTSPHVLYEFI